MALPRLTFVDRRTSAPDVAGYSVGDPNEVIAVKLDGGASRFRRDVVGGAVPVDCQWTLSATDLQAFERFYRDAISNGADPFLVKLTLDGSASVERTVHILPGSKKVAPVGGRKAFTVQVQLEVAPT